MNHSAVGDDLTGADATVAGPTDPRQACEGVGSIVAGKYVLTEVIGEGGMGTVFLARQTEPIKRDVALKLIKGGGDSKGVLARFEAERQALATMDHPNIAKVFDGGATPSGRPFFVMEFIKGTSITEYCDARRFSPRARLELFAEVCQAVQHAHQKGTIHRDLKPGNVLVTEVDGRPTPKVIDFGVAKAAGPGPNDQTFGETGAIVGTPAYMSPEQADPSSMDIDTRTDIYALGVMLYELLTGSTPIDPRALRKGAVLEMLRMVREVEPPRPSVRLKGDHEASSVAASRGVEPRDLLRWVRGDVEWIVMKALEKDRDRRYATANGLAADLRRFLADEPVVARPPSPGYRARKFVRRNRGAVVAAAFVLLALVGGALGTTLGLIEARKQRDLAVQANQQALDALKSFTDDLMGKLLGGKDQLTETERAILRNAQSQWEVFAQSKGDSPEARVVRSEGASELAKVQARLGMTAESEANERAALALRTGLANEFPKVPLYRRKLGTGHQNLGATLRANGQRAEAEAHFRRAVAIFKELADDFPDVPDHRRRWAAGLTSLGNATRDREKWSEAEDHYRGALAVLKKPGAGPPAESSYRYSIINCHWGLAFVLKRAGRPEESEAEYREALALKEELAAESPGDVELQAGAANLRRELGVLLFDEGRNEAGAELFPKAIDVFERLADESPSVPVHRYDLARCRGQFGQVLGYLKRPVEASQQFREAIALQERLVADHPTVLPYLAALGLSYKEFANFLRDGEAPEESLGWFGKGIEALTSAYERDREGALTKSALHKCHADRARAHDRLGRPALALPDWEMALGLCPPEVRDFYRLERAESRLQSGPLAEAIAEVDEIAKSEGASPGLLYDCARLYAITSAKDPGKKDEYASRAVGLLRLALARGHKGHERTATAPDFASIRDRDDFKGLFDDPKRPGAP